MEAASELATISIAALPWAFGFAGVFQAFKRTAPARLNFDDAQSDYWASSCTSNLHALIVVPLAYFAMEPLWWTRDWLHSTPASQRCIEIFLGYIMSDFYPLLKNRNMWSGTTVYIVHHVASYLCWGMMMARGVGHAVGVGLLLVESTAPFVNGRWFLSVLGYKDGPLYAANGLAMFFSFFFLRVVFMGMLLWWHLGVCRESFFALPASTQAIVFVGCGIGYPMQLLWFQKIAVGLLKVLTAPKKQAAAAAGKGNIEASPARPATRATRRAEAFPVDAADDAAAKKKAS